LVPGNEAPPRAVDHYVVPPSLEPDAAEYQTAHARRQHRIEGRLDSQLAEAQSGVAEDDLLQEATGAGYEVHGVVGRSLREHEKRALRVSALAACEHRS